MTATQSEHPELRIGQRIEELRGARGLTLSQVAARSGLPEERLRAFEAGREMPAVGDLVRLAGALDASVGHFFQRGRSTRRVEVVRAADRFVVEPRSSAARTLNYRYQSLSYALTDKLMSPFLVEIPPDEQAAAPTSQHEGEEFLFVLAGQLEVRVGDEVHRLAPGDSIYFDSRTEHSLRAVEGRLVRLVACIAEDRKPHPDDPIGRAYSGH
jgi:transcriptional regulator with XRE-family HTH domain